MYIYIVQKNGCSSTFDIDCYPISYEGDLLLQIDGIKYFLKLSKISRFEVFE